MNAPWWGEPGAEGVAPGVHRIPLPLPNDGLRAVNVYAIEADDGLVLIDSGWALDEARAELQRAVKSFGHDLSDVQTFLITHVHRDHYTQAIALRREFGSRVALGIGERPSLRLRTADARISPIDTQLRMLDHNGASELARKIEASGIGDDPTDMWLWSDPDEWITGDTGIVVGARTLQAIATPGHTQGHLVFRDAGGSLLFAGDHILPHITPSIGFEPVSGQLPLADYLRSLARVRALPDTRLLPAHGPVTRSVHARVDELLSHHEKRLSETAEAVVAGAPTGFEVARALTWTRRDRAFDSLDSFNQMLAVNETVAHLEVLVARHRLQMSDDGTGRYYRIFAGASEDGPVEQAGE